MTPTSSTRRWLKITDPASSQETLINLDFCSRIYIQVGAPTKLVFSFNIAGGTGTQNQQVMTYATDVLAAAAYAKVLAHMANNLDLVQEIT